MPWSRYSVRDVRRMKKYHALGKSFVWIGQKFGCDRTTIMYHVKNEPNKWSLFSGTSSPTINKSLRVFHTPYVKLEEFKPPKTYIDILKSEVRYKRDMRGNIIGIEPKKPFKMPKEAWDIRITMKHKRDFNGRIMKGWDVD